MDYFFIKLLFMSEYGFCPMNDHQYCRRNRYPLFTAGHYAGPFVGVLLFKFTLAHAFCQKLYVTCLILFIFHFPTSSKWCQIICFTPLKLYTRTLLGNYILLGNVSDCRFMSDCRSRGREFDHGPVPYFLGD